MKKSITLLFLFSLILSASAQTAFIPSPHSGLNIIGHIEKPTNNYYCYINISPWKNWIFVQKYYPTSTPWDSIQFILYPAYDTSKAIHLFTLFPKNPAASTLLAPPIDGTFANSVSCWSMLQDTIYFAVRGSTINENNYSQNDYNNPFEFFYLDVSSICAVKIPNIEFKHATALQKTADHSFINRINFRAFPNPSSSKIQIEYEVPKDDYVCINIYDGKGSLIRVLEQIFRKAGKYSTIWDGCTNNGNTLADGEYFYQMVSGNLISTKKLIRLKK